MEKDMRWREITPEQESIFRDRLARFARQPVYIVRGDDGSEIARFAAMLNATLQAAQWQSVLSNSKPRVTMPASGLYIGRTDDLPSQEAAFTLAELLNEMFFDAKYSIPNGPPYWPEETANLEGPKVLVIVRDQPPPASRNNLGVCRDEKADGIG